MPVHAWYTSGHRQKGHHMHTVHPTQLNNMEHVLETTKKSRGGLTWQGEQLFTSFAYAADGSSSSSTAAHTSTLLSELPSLFLLSSCCCKRCISSSLCRRICSSSVVLPCTVTAQSRRLCIHCHTSHLPLQSLKQQLFDWEVSSHHAQHPDDMSWH